LDLTTLDDLTTFSVKNQMPMNGKQNLHSIVEGSCADGTAVRVGDSIAAVTLRKTKKGGGGEGLSDFEQVDSIATECRRRRGSDRFNFEEIATETKGDRQIAISSLSKRTRRYH